MRLTEENGTKIFRQLTAYASIYIGAIYVIFNKTFLGLIGLSLMSHGTKSVIFLVENDLSSLNSLNTPY